MKTYLLFLASIFIFINSFGQLSVLREVHKNRTMARYYIGQGKYDSAHIVIARYIDNDTYTNGADYLNFYVAGIKTKDTATFNRYMAKAIGYGADTDMIHAYLRIGKVTGTDLLLANNYLDNHYRQLRDAGYVKYDTSLIAEIKLISDLDQTFRGNTAWTTNANRPYVIFIANQVDSINYERVVKLFETGRYPGYHNCGFYFVNMTPILAHISDANDARWQYIFKKIKEEEELKGNITPDEVATIADRHFTGRTTPHSYYGHWKGRTSDLYDCKNVDKIRAEIGLEDLKTEYERAKRTIPERYGQ